MPQWQLDPELKKRQLDQIKQAIDADGDGQISAKEFNIATQRLGLNGFIMQELGGQQQPAMVLMAQPPMVNAMNVEQAQTAVTIDAAVWAQPYAKITAEELEGCYVCACFPLIMFYGAGRHSRTCAPRASQNARTLVLCPKGRERVP